MLTFWIICLFLVVVALVLVLPSLMTASPPVDDERQAMNRAIFDRKLKELDQDLQRDLIDREQFEIARSDLRRTLIHDLEDHETPALKKSGKSMAVIVLLAVPMLSVFTYLKINNGLASLSDNFQAELSGQGRMLTVEQAIMNLERRLREVPDDMAGWSMLGRSYLAQGNFSKAVEAYERAYGLTGGTDPDVLVGYAEAQALAAGQRFDEGTMAYFVRAVQIDPHHERGLWYAGFAAYQLHDYLSAAKYWGRLLEQVPDDQQDVRTTLQTYLDEARQKAKLDVADASQDMGETRASGDNTAAGASIDVQVSLSAALQEKISNSDILFVYARALEGPPMPLALVRMNAGKLPVRVTLDDTDAMISGMTLSGMEEVEIVARISKSGQARMQAGDLYGSVRPVATSGAGQIHVVISEVAP